MLCWSFKDKIGEATILQGEDEQKLSLYQGNAFLIFLKEFKDEEGNDKHSLWTFFADEQHAKNCLGLSKEGYESIFDSQNMLTKISINKAKYSYTKKLVDLLVRAFDEIQINIYSE